MKKGGNKNNNRKNKQKFSIPNYTPADRSVGLSKATC
jgi:hypothetical protein